MNRNMKATSIASIIFMIAVASACMKSGENSSGVEKPDLDKGCLSGQCVDGQFETTYQRFAVVSGNSVNLRPRPDVTSKVLMRLRSTKKVTVLYVNPEEVTIGSMKGRWAFVRDAMNIGMQGWIFDRFLAFTGHFTKPASWAVREIRVILKGKLTVYRCTPDAKFEIIQNEMIYKKDGSSLDKKVTGDILRYENILWFKKDRPDDYPIFFRELPGGKLELPDQYAGMRGVVIVK
ncbi:MAG: SH3 domain-containing protein [Spirochaetes bacterium]|nr:SH3 domain-containing protein [Spirochaetota bacterium]